ncbi:hypothetical protein [Microbacterium sp. E-13]|uniref:hypothetical protein n=1 Tax=Microbacterium sp. E-13 TaxID=3404048 RepID=UPI003CF13329
MLRPLAVVAAVLALNVSTVSPASAASIWTGKTEDPSASDTSVTVVMEWNCGELTEADRRKAIAGRIQMCGINEPITGTAALAGGVTPTAINNNNCGTAVINVGQSGGRANIHYALHSSQGFITGRGLHVWWGPTFAGSKYDFGPFWGTSFYGSQLNVGYAMNGKKFGATMSGWVTIAGWTLSCNVYVSEPVHKL